MNIGSGAPGTLASTIGGRYTVIRELGRGGMATVYLATDATDGRQVAVKLLHPDLAASIGGERFLREIQLGQKLRHDRIVSVLASGESGGQLWYAMPFVDGESLSERITRQKQLTIDDTLAITKQVAEALDFAHANGVVHRDIKPENIMLAGNEAYVMDFGIAHAVTEAGGEKLTKTGMAIGTPAYMSPEQAVGARDVTAQSDIYSLGCVVYEMLAGDPPFAGANAMALLAKHSLESVPSVRVVRASVPPQLEDAIFCALEKTPADRFKSAGDFAKALAGEFKVPKHTKERQTLARGGGRQKNGRGMLIGAAAAVLLLGGGGFAAWKFMGAGSGVASRIGSDSDPTHIAVLYFEDGSPAKDLGFVADGLTEALIHELSSVKQLKVISRNGVAPLKGKVLAPDSVGRSLKVGTIVTGKLSQAGDKLRLEVALIDALDGEQIESTRIDQPRDSIIALQDSLAKQVSLVLRRQLGEEVKATAGRASTRNAKAWEQLQRAKQTIAAATELTGKRNVQGASDKLREADKELAAVEQMDGKWNEPTVERAWVAYQQARLPLDPTKIGDWVKEGLGHAERALARNAADADALEARGTLRYWGFLQGIGEDAAASEQLIKGAEDDLKAATKANTQQAGAWNILSHLYLRKTKPSEAKLAADNAYEADPYLSEIDRTMWRRFQASLDLGDRKEAVKACDLLERRFPDNYRFAECRLWIHAMLHPTPPQPVDIWKDYERFVEMSPPARKEFLSAKGKMMAALGLVRANLPDSARNLAVATQMAATTDPEKELLFLRAVLHAQIDTPKDKDQAISLLKRFMAGAPQAGDGSQDESWWFKNLATDPRYREMMGQ